LLTVAPFWETASRQSRLISLDFFQVQDEVIVHRVEWARAYQLFSRYLHVHRLTKFLPVNFAKAATQLSPIKYLPVCTTVTHRTTAKTTLPLKAVTVGGGNTSVETLCHSRSKNFKDLIEAEAIFYLISSGRFVNG